MLRVGVVGVKGIGQAHLWALKSVDETVLAAVCDIDVEGAESAAAAFEVPAFAQASEMYASDAVDAVVIATPAGTHGELARDALAARLHVYCEKPVTPTSDEGYALAADARARELVFQVGFQFRFHKGYAALREHRAGIGALRRVHVVGTNWFRPQAYFDQSPWRATWRMAGGGVLMNQAIHQVDALIAAVGMPNRVRGEARNAMHVAEVEDEAIVTMEWADGGRGTLAASLTEMAGRERFELYGDDGAIVFSGNELRVAHFDTRHVVDESVDAFAAYEIDWERTDVTTDEFGMFKKAHREFAAAVTEVRPSAIDGVSGTQSVELANAIYLSSLTGDAVALPLRPGTYPPVYEELASGHRVLPS